MKDTSEIDLSLHHNNLPSSYVCEDKYSK